MKSTSRLIFFVFTLLALTASANAQSPREQLQQMVEQLQKTPNDSALREKIVNFALTLKPSPALPSEAERRMARGRAAFKGATSVTDYQDAAKEFEQATLAAPWHSDAYFNLGLAQDKAGNYGSALRSLKLAQLASPDSKEITALIYEVEYRQEKANSPAAHAAREKEAAEARAAREKQAEQHFISSIEGAKYVCPEYRDDRDANRVEIDIRNGKIDGATIITWINPKLRPGVDYASNAFVGFRGLWFEDIPLRGRVNVKRTQYGEMRVEIYDDRLVYVHQITFAGHSSPTVYPAQTCLRIK